MTGIEIIAAERQRQIDVEGWTPEHDDTHVKGELALAAYAYALPECERPGVWDMHGTFTPSGWPWEPSLFKPTPDDRVRELAKAGALIAAEIDRLERLKEKQ